MFEFHISRTARDRYGVTGILFAFNGNAVFADPSASRSLAYRINQARAADPQQQVQPAALFAVGLIDEATHALLAWYRKHVKPSVMTEALAHFSEQVGPDELNRLLLEFVNEFPNAEVYAGKQTPQQWLAGATEGYPHREAAFEELLLLWLQNRNPAFAPFRELFDDTRLAQTTVYQQITAALPDFFAALPKLGAQRGSLLALLLSVMDGPASLSDQLARLRARWGFAVDDLLRRILLAGDVLKEEEVALWLQFNPSRSAGARPQSGTEASAEVPNFAAGMAEYENFSPDQDWMPRTVMIAKSTFVWLNQLSRFYGRPIERLDQIPDEELQTLASRGMNALWLIGVWERSRASQTIKHLCGNPDAVASAYSLYDYQIAHQLGGEPAYRDLRDRCARHGIRLASDMVPNHMGIDSPWVINHPEWFLSRPDSPYPAYSFNGPDLSGDDRVEIKIEDHYYQQTDAAVVFLRRDKWTGDHQYIYHGNDGTSFPWNDTAQLNYLSAQVREQVIQTILQVARQFPIIRFDAAMTLAKRHIQRLWFPTPGSGGSIPSRAESAMTTAEFDAAIPEEFWREVVDRVAREVPGTLLLAEAFWLMEGYFVRTLGMHRVYNSAFMVMLRDEDNANYRLVLKNTLEFDPGIMKRYVNFMSNPDERTAIDQFGSGDKFFGVATMMATLPGLPMFGHGQVEGFTEKYGMEYYRPRYDEWPADNLVERHQREIAPLLHNRDLFAESDNFLLYDCRADGGGVNEDVFAYSNQRSGPYGIKRALIVYNNSYSGAHGTVDQSAAYMDKGSGQLRQRSLTDALALPADPNTVLAWRNNATGLHHLRRANEFQERGFHIDLPGYGYTVLLDWRELHSDATHAWHRLCDLLAGRGVEDLDRALLNLELKPLHDWLLATLDPRLVREFASLANQAEATIREDPALLPHSELLEQWITRAATFIEGARSEYFKRVQPQFQPEAPGISLIPGTSSENSVTAENSVIPENGGNLSEAGALAPKDLLSLDKQTTPGAPHLASEIWDSQQPSTPTDSPLQAAEAQNEQSLTATRLRTRIQSLLRLPLAEQQFAEPWPREARSVLPSLSPLANAGSVWAPVLAYTLLAALGESLSMADPRTPALAIYDQFGIRSVLAESFSALDFTGQDTWRAAARVRLALAAGILPSEPEPSGKHSEDLLLAANFAANLPANAKQHGLFASAWQDGDLRWLSGVNEHEGATYFNKESHEQMLWWHTLPDLLQITAQPALDPQEIEALQTQIATAQASAAAAGYQLTPPPTPPTKPESKSVPEPPLTPHPESTPSPTKPQNIDRLQAASIPEDEQPTPANSSFVDALPANQSIPLSEALRKKQAATSTTSPKNAAPATKSTPAKITRSKKKPNA
jgi:glycosidase